ncbi:ATP-dependent RNA helicase DbpA [Solimonas sp. SE-A11]|uniref:ATP-dependent RNA helicase DbpA n=1 Tax=Solimonas sp. SE-A11 TaxID=3054954 RepID=UPI00259CEAD9|nr:ATP-dependent RNA helicase DbpA [Solimonas sp. SE-A11]
MDNKPAQPPSQPFNSLPLHPALLQALDSLEYRQMTPIQALSLPLILEGRDVIGQARTGSGKTAAYGLGLLSRIDPALPKLQALVLCPTRELADQISKEIRRLARCLPNIKLTVLGGGISKRPQLASLEHDPHIIVGMAGRVGELLTEGALKLDDLRVLVLDEADRMLDGDFEQASRAIIQQSPKTRQTLFFSATFPDAVRAVSQRLQKNPVEARTDLAAAPGQIEQKFYEVDDTRRLDALAHLLSTRQPESALVFCYTKNDAQEVEAQLRKRGFSVLSLHGDIDQRERDEMLVRFANGSARILVATDIAARGLDIKNLACVLSYELPSDPDAHVHRVGRTGRAGAAGLALHLFTGREHARVTAIEQRLGTTVEVQRLAAGSFSPDKPLKPMVMTLCVDAGRSDKLRPGDLLGALTGDAGIPNGAIGKINTFDTRTYVAVDIKQAKKALDGLRNNKIKGRKFRVREIV